MNECTTKCFIYLWWDATVMFFVSLSLFFYGLITLPMNRGAAASSLHSIRTKGCRAEKEEKEREKEMLVAAAASTPFSVSERKARWRTSEMNDSGSPGNIPHKLGLLKRSDKPKESRGKDCYLLIYSSSLPQLNLKLYKTFVVIQLLSTLTHML